MNFVSGTTERCSFILNPLHSSALLTLLHVTMVVVSLPSEISSGSIFTQEGDVNAHFLRVAVNMKRDERALNLGKTGCGYVLKIP